MLRSRRRANEDGALIWNWNQILYPLAERVIPDTMRDDIIARYAAAKTKTAADFSVKYEAVVVGYEQE